METDLDSLLFACVFLVIDIVQANCFNG